MMTPADENLQTIAEQLVAVIARRRVEGAPDHETAPPLKALAAGFALIARDEIDAARYLYEPVRIGLYAIERAIETAAGEWRRPLWQAVAWGMADLIVAELYVRKPEAGR